MSLQRIFVIGLLAVGPWILVLGIVGTVFLLDTTSSDLEEARIRDTEIQFSRVKNGDTYALVWGDLRLIARLADDPDCCVTVTELHFTSVIVDSEDSIRIAELRNLSSLNFYCTRGTAALLNNARHLPITYIGFETTDMKDSDFMILRNFKTLERVGIGDYVTQEFADALSEYLPGVRIDAHIDPANKNDVN